MKKIKITPDEQKVLTIWCLWNVSIVLAWLVIIVLILKYCQEESCDFYTTSDYIHFDYPNSLRVAKGKQTAMKIKFAANYYTEGGEYILCPVCSEKLICAYGIYGHFLVCNDSTCGWKRSYDKYLDYGLLGEPPDYTSIHKRLPYVKHNHWEISDDVSYYMGDPWDHCG